MQLPAIITCPQCATQLASSMKACPVCARLVHSDGLTSLSQIAKAATERGDLPAALMAWREALELLPTGSKQFQLVSAKITELSEKVPDDATPARSPTGQKNSALQAAAGLGAVGMILWKFKALAMGLTKGTTLLTMLLSLGMYWTVWGWKFALGLVLSIYIHEMGHVIALRRYGIKASAPMFIPGLGALVRLQQKVMNPREDAEIGLAGPIYGFGAAVASLLLWLVTNQTIFAAIASAGAWINLFNLLPISPLDGGRGFHPMSRLQKFIAALFLGGTWLATNNGLLSLLAIVAFGRALVDKSNGKGYWRATIAYCALVVALTAIWTVQSQIGLDNRALDNQQPTLQK